jgi:glycosyltransferase involved in cell wall biosynthesis
VAVGDIMLGDSASCVGFGFRTRYQHHILPAFAGVEAQLRRGEVVYGNLECMLTRRGRGSTRLQTDQMRGDPEYASTLRAAGFTALGVANNHAMQHGLEAFEQTVDCLQRAGIAVVGLRGHDGWCAAPVVQTTRAGLRVGLLGYSWRPRQYDEGTPPYAEGDVAAVEQDVKQLAKLVDVVVVGLHWGEEFLGLPSADEVGAAHRIIEAGARVIIGHHPHVVRPVEQYAAGVICYSLGNFVTDMVWQPELRQGLIFQSRLARGGPFDSTLSRTVIDDSYAPGVVAAEAPLPTGRVVGLDESGYRRAVAQSVGRQRRAAYGYMIRNLFRYPPLVLAELVAMTVRNKVLALGSPRTTNRADNANTASRLRGDAARQLSILHVAAPARFGGLETVVRELARGHSIRGHVVRVALVLSPGKESHPLADALAADGVEVFPLRIGDRDYRGERRAIRALCERYRPDIVHTHGYRCDVVDGQVAQAQRIPIVSTCHGFIDSNWRGRLHQWLQRRALKRFDAVIAVSRAIEKRLLNAGVEAARVRVVPNAAPPTATVSRKEARRLLDLPDAPIIGWVGRLSAEKGADVALEAFARLAHPDAYLVMLGSGRDAPELRDRAADLGVANRVIWRSAVPNAGELFAAFDAFLLSSRTEGTPMALLEAMSASVPIVATRVGGVPDVIDSSSAHLVESGDVTSMAAALGDVFRDPAAAHDRAHAARIRLEERFAVDPWLTSYESIFRGLVSAR